MDMYEKKKIAELVMRDSGHSVSRDEIREYVQDTFSFLTTNEETDFVNEIFGLIQDAEIIIFWNEPA